MTLGALGRPSFGRPNGRLKRAASVAAIALGLFAAAALAYSHLTEQRQQSHLDAWVLPSDRYHVGSEQVIGHAIAHLVARCDDEYQIPAGAFEETNAGEQAGSGVNKVGRYVFTVSTASSRGYRFPETGTPYPNTEFDRVEPKCLDWALEQIPAPPDESTLFTLSSAAYWEAMNDPGVTDAGLSWTACMIDLGYKNLPNTPEEMPNAAAWRTLGVKPEDLDTVASPSRDEIRMAVSDAECRASSGFNKLLYEVEYAINLRMTKENEARLQAERTALQNRLAAARSIIATSHDGGSPTTHGRG